MGLWGWGGSNSAKSDDELTDDDKIQRAGEQARAAIFGSRWEDSSPDEDGHATGGDNNGDYPDSYHEKLNQRMKDDEYYEAEVERDLGTLLKWTIGRREG